MSDIVSIRLENENNKSVKIINIIGKTIKMLSFLRSAYSFVKSSYKENPLAYQDYDLAKPGVYMLISEDNKSIYIGESDNILERLNTHYSTDEKTEYWVKTMVFVADGNYPLNISQIKYIESKLLEYAKSVAQIHVVDVNLKNKKPSLLPNISTNDKVVAENFLGDIITLTKTLGIDFFDISKTIVTADEIANKELLEYWMPVDLYMGGPEHSVGHLLYSRFWNNYLYNKGIVPVKEPFAKLRHQGMILGANGEKMSKSKGNVINPDDMVKQYSADALRVYEMFMGPIDAAKPWDPNGIDGSKKFLERVWRLYTESGKIKNVENINLEKTYHFTVKKVTKDYENMYFNSAISQMMIFY